MSVGAQCAVYKRTVNTDATGSRRVCIIHCEIPVAHPDHCLVIPHPYTIDELASHHPARGAGKQPWFCSKCNGLAGLLDECFSTFFRQAQSSGFPRLAATPVRTSSLAHTSTTEWGGWWRGGGSFERPLVLTARGGSLARRSGWGGGRCEGRTPPPSVHVRFEGAPRALLVSVETESVVFCGEADALDLQGILNRLAHCRQGQASPEARRSR